MWCGELLVELLMEKISFECVEEALLHAISKGATKLVKVIIEHPNYIAGAEQCKRTQKDPFFRTDEKSQFSPDITPLILAARRRGGLPSTDPGRALQQPRDHPDVHQHQPHHRQAAPDRLPVHRLRHQAELRLAQEVKVGSRRGQGRGCTPTGRWPAQRTWRCRARTRS